MFPKCSLSEARSALSIAKGDMEEAVRLIIEGDVQLSPTPLNVSLWYTQKHSFLSVAAYFVYVSSLIWWCPVATGKPWEEFFLTGRPET